MKMNNLLFLVLAALTIFSISCSKEDEDPIVPEEGTMVINEVYTWSPQKEIDDLDFIELYN